MRRQAKDGYPINLLPNFTPGSSRFSGVTPKAVENDSSLSIWMQLKFESSVGKDSRHAVFKHLDDGVGIQKVRVLT